MLVQHKRSQIQPYFIIMLETAVLNFKNKNMKNIKIILALFVLSIGNNSCSKDDNPATKPIVSEEVYRIKKQLLSIGQTIVYEYNSAGGLTDKIFKTGVFQKYTYNSQEQILTSELGGLPNVADNNITINEYDTAGKKITEITTSGDGSKFKYVFDENTANLSTNGIFFNWVEASNSWVEDVTNNQRYFYNSANQVIRFERINFYILYFYDSKGNQNENKAYYKKATAGYYLKSHTNITFDNKKAIKISPSSKVVNNPLETIIKNYAENSTIISQQTYTNLYEYNAFELPEKRFLNGILQETNTFEKVN